MTTHEPDVDELFRQYRRTRDVALRNRLVELHLDQAEHLVRRYRSRSVPEDDLRQVALLGVLHAVERFDPDRGFAFATFANRTIDGDVKRYFRDRSWSVRPPRRAQELYLQVRHAEEELTHELGRSPRVGELAERLDLSEEQVLEGLEAATAYRAASLDQPVPGADSDEAPSVVGLAETEHGFEHTEVSLWLARAMEGLDERDRAILEMRFVRGLTQSEIAEAVGVSQSYLSRQLRRLLGELRERLSD